MPLHRVALEVAVADENAKQHARDIGVENRGPLAEREASDRAGGVGADALERQQPPYRSTASRAMLCSRFGLML